MLTKAEDRLSETTGKAMIVKESFKKAHQWYSDVIPKITELQKRVVTDLARISALKAIVQDRYNIERTVKVIAERKRKKNVRKEKRKKLTQTGSLNSSVSEDTITEQNSQKLMSSFVKKDPIDEAQESTRDIIEEEISVTCDSESGNGDMISKAAKECVTLHQAFEEKWGIFDNHSKQPQTVKKQAVTRLLMSLL